MKEYLNKITCGDSLDVMRKLPNKCIDLILTDPPYGIGIKGKTGGGNRAKVTDYGDFNNWDNFIPNKKYFDEMFRISKNQIIFGGNYFAEYLKNSSCWIVWNKDNGSNNFADCELAWTSFSSAVRMVKYKWNGMLQENMKYKEKRIHPTQKPLDVFKWILKNYSEKGQIVCDPFAGSCTTAQACFESGINFICIEKISKYCELGKKRLSQQVLF